MEIKKDNQKDKGIMSLKYSPDLFHNDQDLYRCYKKIEKIVSAVFLTTSLIEKDELTKKTIREHGLDCLNQIVSFIGKSDVSVNNIQSVAVKILHLNSLLDIAFWAGQISQMNLSILQKEITSTYEMLNDLSSKYGNTFFINSSFFKDSQVDHGGLIKDKNNSRNLSSQAISRGVDISKGQESDKRQYVKDSNKGQRREAVLSLLRQKTNLTIKDFLVVVPEYSEKTIQRELLSLVEEGFVKKEGERRWSTYSIL